MHHAARRFFSREDGEALSSAPWALGREVVARGCLVIILWMGIGGRVVRGEPVLAGERRRERDGPAATAQAREPGCQ